MKWGAFTPEIKLKLLITNEVIPYLILFLTNDLFKSIKLRNLFQIYVMMCRVEKRDLSDFIKAWWTTQVPRVK